MKKLKILMNDFEMNKWDKVVEWYNYQYSDEKQMMISIEKEQDSIIVFYQNELSLFYLGIMFENYDHTSGM